MIREPTIVERLHVPVPGTAPRAPIQPFYRYHLDRYQERLEKTLALHIRRAPRRIYLSRSHLLHKGGFVGCSYFEAALQRAGVVSITPEAMSLSLQFAHLLGAETILADEGSALHPTQVLSRLKGEVLMFPRRRRNQIYSDALSQRGRFEQLVPSEEIKVLSDRFGRNGSPGMLAVYRDPEALYERLRLRGLVEGPFDWEAYRAAEAADLEAARPARPEVMSKWTRELAGLRR